MACTGRSTYGFQPEQDEVTPGYAYASALTMGVEGGLIAWNLAADPDSPRLARGAAGVAGGTLGMLYGAVAVFGGNGDRTLGMLNAAAGATSAMLGLRTLLRRPDPDPAPPSSATIAASPWLAERGGAGVVVRLSF